MSNIAYIRVSSADQNEARQHEAMKGLNIDKTFIDHGISGKSTDRPQLQAMLDYVREGDTIYISEFSRLARNTRDLLDIVEDLTAKGIKLVSLKENLDTATPTGRLMLTMIGAIAEFERELILERQREGIKIAKQEGRYKGGQPKKIDRQQFDALSDLYYQRKINKVEFAKRLNVSRPTLDKLLKQQSQEE